LEISYKKIDNYNKLIVSNTYIKTPINLQPKKCKNYKLNDTKKKRIWKLGDGFTINSISDTKMKPKYPKTI